MGAPTGPTAQRERAGRRRQYYTHTVCARCVLFLFLCVCRILQAVERVLTYVLYTIHGRFEGAYIVVLREAYHAGVQTRPQCILFIFLLHICIPIKITSNVYAYIPLTKQHFNTHQRFQQLRSEHLDEKTRQIGSAAASVATGRQRVSH